ncbi:MAG: TIGR04283 family arsenosugar biosynthesis glycosyltransferase [Burkholderiaceae bacterium]
MKLSIIVPLLNEAQELPGLLEQLLHFVRLGVEVIIADGGSSDGCADIAECAGFTVVRTARGRARQMNAAAALATGDTLLFLHADTRLPRETKAHITQALTGEKQVWGRFDVCISGRSAMLRVISHMMNLRSRLTGIATGDQTIFVTRSAFDAVEGFPDQPLMEDIELSKRLLTLSRPACIAQCVVTSGRRWEAKGVWRTIFLMWRLRWNYWRGVSAQRLLEDYR